MTTMSKSAKTARGTALLLRHCATVLPPERPPARERLAALIGHDFARALVAALTDRPPDCDDPRALTRRLPAAYYAAGPGGSWPYRRT